MNQTLRNTSEDIAPAITFNGDAGYHIQGDRVTVSIAEIANNRAFGNLSGTIAVELWALSTSYTDGNFQGQALAATTIGELQGQHCLRQCQYDLVFHAPAAGEWHLCLMIREWEQGGYVTRDFVNFPVTYVASENRPAVTKTTDNVIAVDFGDVAGRAEPTSDDQEPKTTAKKTVNESTAKKVVKPVTVEADVKPAIQKTERAPKASTKVSVNQASLAELEGVSGISKKLAKNIVESRPFKRLEELLKVTGMGKKLLKKLESKIEL